jgi:hypothetical protein
VLALVAVAWLSWGRTRAVPGPEEERGAPDGRMMRGVVRAREVDAWTLRFAAGRPATIWVEGQATSSLDCVAQDAAGNLLDVDAGERGRCHLRWVPARTGSYRVMIRNSGHAASAYRLVAR